MPSASCTTACSMGPSIPVVPVFLNTYYPPNQPTPGRCYKLGQAIRQAVESFPGNARVGVIASGGLSHFTVDEELDGRIIRALRQKDVAALRDLPRRAAQFRQFGNPQLDLHGRRGGAPDAAARCSTSRPTGRRPAPAPAFVSPTGADGDPAIRHGRRAGAHPGAAQRHPLRGRSDQSLRVHAAGRSRRCPRSPPVRTSTCTCPTAWCGSTRCATRRASVTATWSA